MSSCKLCASLSAHTKLEYNDVLAKEHAQVHFRQLIIFDAEITFDQILEQCFPKNGKQILGHQRAPRVFRKASNLSAKRTALCRQLTKKFGDRNGKVQCRLCAKGIGAKQKGGDYNSDSLLEHAFRHLQKPTIRCKICSDSFSNSWILAHHLRKVHALPMVNNYERQEDPFHDDIMTMLRKCYSDEEEAVVDGTPRKILKRETSSVCKTNRGSNLKIERRMYCYGLCRKYLDQEGKIKCHLCAKRIPAKDAKDSIKSESVLKHALTHLSHSDLNRCKICSKTFLTQICMAQHLRVMHALPMANNYEYLADEFHHEILDVVRRCYDVNADGANAESATSTTSEKKIRNPVKGSKLAIERQVLCVRLIKKFLDRDGKMHCRLCSNRIRATTQSGCYLTPTVAMHALTHTQRSFYRCKLCSKKFVTRPNMGSHLREVHRKTKLEESKYECLEDQFHSEIVDTLRKCYGNEEEAGLE